MPTLPIDIELDRLMNLIRGFGWKISNKEITDSKATLEIVKDLVSEKTPPSP